MSTRVRLVCFDWGGVILKICRSWEEGCARAGLDVRAGIDGPELKEARRRASEEYQRGLIACDEFCRRVAAGTGGVYEPGEIRKIHDAWLIEEYAGVGAVVEKLNATRGVETGLLSNTNHMHWERHLPGADGKADFPTVGRLTHRYFSHLMGLAKPTAEIYRAMQESAGFEPGEILFLDDLEENVSAARGSGWRSEQIDHTGDTAKQITRILRAYEVW